MYQIPTISLHHLHRPLPTSSPSVADGIDLEVGEISDSDFEVVEAFMTAIFPVENPNPTNRFRPEFRRQLDQNPRVRLQFGLSAGAELGTITEDTFECEFE